MNSCLWFVVATQPNSVGLCIYCPPNPQMYNSQSFMRRLEDPLGFRPSLFHQRTLFCRFGYGAPFFLEAAPFGSLWIPLVVHVVSCASLQLISKHPTSAWKADEPTLFFRVELPGFSAASSVTCSRWDFHTQGIVECRHVLVSTQVICPPWDISDRGSVPAPGDRAPGSAWTCRNDGCKNRWTARRGRVGSG